HVHPEVEAVFGVDEVDPLWGCVRAGGVVGLRCTGCQELGEQRGEKEQAQHQGTEHRTLVAAEVSPDEYSLRDIADALGPGGVRRRRLWGVRGKRSVGK